MNLNRLAGLSGKVVVYTGAAGLIGRHAVHLLVENGVRLIAVDPNYAKLLELSKNIYSKFPDNPIEIHSNLDDQNPNSVENFFKSIVYIHGKIDCLVNSAYPRTADWGSRFEDIPFESWRKNVDTHLNSYFLMCQKVSDIFINQKFGNIVNFSSIYGIGGPDFTVYDGLPMTMPAAYAAIKGGISNLTKYMAAYLGPSGIRVNAICPGGILDHQDERFVERYTHRTPMRRMASVDDVTKALIFLISDLSSYVSGVNLPVDGGWSAI